MENYIIRYARKEDYKAVEVIMKQVQDLHINWRPDIYKQADVILPQDMFDEAVDEERFVVAEADEKVIGILCFVHRHIEFPHQVTRDILYVDSLAVDEDYRGKGVGHLLLDFVKCIAKEKNFDGIELQVNAKNSRAKQMYESYGFTEKSINMELK